jgi:hypothetical protein
VRFLLLVLLASLLAAGCGGSEADEPPPAQLTGVIVEVRNGPGGGIESFALEANDETHTIYIAPDVDYGFTLTHLHEHRATGEPVRCELEERGERLYALEIVDAPVT